MTKIDLKTAGPFIALVALFIIGIFVNDAFLSAGNVSNILARSSFIGIVAIGATFVITTGGIDLSVGSMAAFISGCMILLMNALMSTFDSLITIIFSGNHSLCSNRCTCRNDQWPANHQSKDRGVYRDPRHDGNLPFACYLYG